MIKKTVTLFEEITEPNVEYHLNDTDKWVRIDKDNYGWGGDEYSIAYMFYPDQQQIGFAIKNHRIMTWKTFNGAKRYFLREITF